jgi:hypothetical protein
MAQTCNRTELHNSVHAKPQQGCWRVSHTPPRPRSSTAQMAFCQLAPQSMIQHKREICAASGLGGITTRQAQQGSATAKPATDQCSAHTNASLHLHALTAVAQHIHVSAIWQSSHRASLRAKSQPRAGMNSSSLAHYGPARAQASIVSPNALCPQAPRKSPHPAATAPAPRVMHDSSTQGCHKCCNPAGPAAAGACAS